MCHEQCVGNLGVCICQSSSKYSLKCNMFLYNLQLINVNFKKSLGMLKLDDNKGRRRKDERIVQCTQGGVISFTSLSGERTMTLHLQIKTDENTDHQNSIQPLVEQSLLIEIRKQTLKGNRAILFQQAPWWKQGRNKRYSEC